MRRTTLIGLFTTVLGIVLMAGCIPSSLHPVYRPQDLVFDPALLGIWTQTDSDSIWVFKEGHEEKTYHLIHIEGTEDPAAFTVRLASVDGLTLLDLYPQSPAPGGSSYYKLHLIPAHTFLVVDQIEPTLKVRMMNIEWLDALLGAQPDALKHERLEDHLVLTAESEPLQAFIRQHLDTPEAWHEAEYIRQTSSVETE